MKIADDYPERLADMQGEKDKLAKRVAELEAIPLAPRARLKAIDKAEDNAVYSQNLSDARKAYNQDVDAANTADSENGGNSDIIRSHFDDLSSQAQTVIMSTRYNMGPNYKYEGEQHKNLWDSLVNSDFSGAATALLALGAAEKNKGLRNRRNAEADYLTSDN